MSENESDSEQASERMTPIFAKTLDFLAWLIPLTDNFPRSHRHTVTRRLVDATLDYYECLVEANHLRGPGRLQRLADANAQLDKVRHYWRLVYHWRWTNPGQYEHGGRMVAELGRLLGGWQKVTRQRSVA